jgi:hypothetical protein
VLLVAAVLTAVYSHYQYYVHDGGMQLRDNFGQGVFVVSSSRMHQPLFTLPKKTPLPVFTNCFVLVVFPCLPS